MPLFETRPGRAGTAGKGSGRRAAPPIPEVPTLTDNQQWEWEGQDCSCVFLGVHKDFCAACDQWDCGINYFFLDCREKNAIEPEHF